MLLRLPSPDTPLPVTGVRWRRGDAVDVDPDFAGPLLKAGAKEITREEAAEVILDDAPKLGGATKGGRGSRRGAARTRAKRAAPPPPAAEVPTSTEAALAPPPPPASSLGEQ